MIALVTGGGGFLGSAIVHRLADRGDRVRSLSRNCYPELVPLGVEQFQGDVADAEAMDRAVAGCDVVFHVAAKAGIWGPRREFYRTNVAGTETVVAACLRHEVRRLVFTSSPSVVFSGRDMENVNESAPFSRHFEAHYPQTKAIAEQKVLEANGPELATVSLRPHLIWGPGDNHLVPRIIARGRAGKLCRIGSANKLVDSTYIDNAADAHVSAADRLLPGSPVAGKTYFISNGEPLPLWDLIDRILATVDGGPVTRTIPYWLAYAMGSAMEKTYSILGRKAEPPMTRFLARELTTSHWFDLTAARRDLGYNPTVSIDEGLRRLASSLRPAAMR